jgi:hypothetical protein
MTDAHEGSPLWTDNDIFKCLQRNGLRWVNLSLDDDGKGPHISAITGANASQAMLDLRAAYQADRAKLQAALAERDAKLDIQAEIIGRQAVEMTKAQWQIAELEAQLAEAKQETDKWYEMFSRGGRGEPL